MAQINKPNTYFNTVLYTGNGSTQSITGVNFQPDLLWIKSRSNAYSHLLANVIAGASKTLQSDSTASEQTYGCINSFDTDGFTVDLDGTIGANNNGSTFVAWNWLAGGSPSSNTDGSITSSVSANTTSGFSIVTYTGTGSLATVGHGLGSAPKMVIAKNRGSTSNWDCYHVGLSGANYRIQLNSTGAQSISGGSWGSTAPTSTVFTVQDDTATNVNGNTYVAYCFAEKKGFSKFGSYTGNGSADGAFVYCGFKPAFVIIKNITDASTHWRLTDSTRYPNNLTNTIELYPSTSAAETTNEPTFDFLSNGFKLRGDTVYKNGSGSTYIYAAFAENPLVGTNNIPATAR